MVNKVNKIVNNMNKIKKLKAEKRDELRVKLKQRQAGLAEQVRKMKTNKDYAGDVKKFMNKK